MVDNLISRAHILIQQNRYDEAGKLLKDVLRQDPNNIDVLAMLAQVKLYQDDVEDAAYLIDTAIGLAPDTAYLYYIKARLSLKKEQLDNTESDLQQAIELDPFDADYFALWALVKLSRKQFEKALELANAALELDAENIQALNVRSTALIKLDKKEEAFITIEGALQHDPNNAYTHANYGWSLLEKGDHKKSLEHFREALRNDPNYEYAKAGMAEALKGRYLLYKLFLRYSFWIGNLTAKYQWGVIIGFFLATRLLKILATSFEGLQIILAPLIIIVALMAFSTWVMTPISNLFLRLNPYGKYLLNKEQIQSSNFTGLSVGIMLIGLLGYVLTGDVPWSMIAIFGFVMMVPCSMMFKSSKYNLLFIYAIAMFAVGIAAIIDTFLTDEVFNNFTTIFLVGFIAFQWLANFMLIRESNV